MDSRARHLLLSLFSPAYPVGSFAYSHGLESAIANGAVTCADDLTDWLTDVLRHGTGRTDAILLARAARAPETAAELSALAEALAPSRERHAETMAQGAAFARVTAAVHGTDPAPLAFPVAVGAAAAVLNVPLPDTMGAYLHAFAANLVSAAVRLVPLGQTDGQAVLAALFPIIDATAADALGADPDDLGGFAPAADLAAMHHETKTVRLFRT